MTEQDQITVERAKELIRQCEDDIAKRVRLFMFESGLAAERIELDVRSKRYRDERPTKILFRAEMVCRL